MLNSLVEDTEREEGLDRIVRVKDAEVEDVAEQG